MKKIKVLHLSSEKTWRGGEQQIAYLVSELQAMGIANIVAVKKDSAFEKYCQKKKISFFSLPFKNSIDIRTSLAVKKICKDQGVNIIHLHSSKSHGIGVLSAVLGNKTFLILSRRVDFVPKNTWFTRWKYNHSSIKKILCVSHKIREIMQAYVSKAEVCITIHDGVDLNRFSTKHNENVLKNEFTLPAQTILIGNTSALEDHKDYFTFINTIGILIQKKVSVKAFIIGKGSLETALKKYVIEKGLADHVIFTGFRTDITRMLPALDIFLMTSKEEGLGTSVLDAFAAGVPVVATRAGGIPEMVRHEHNGLLAAIGDAEGLASHIQRIIADHLLRDRIINLAKERLREFSKEETARKTLQVYRELLDYPA